MQLPFTLPSPVSREAAVALGHGRLLLLGGLTAADTSSSAVELLDGLTGSVVSVGSLALATHDAGGAAAGREALVFGGGQATSVATVQAFPTAVAAAAAAGRSPAVGSVVGRLPGVRSDDAAIAIGGTAYVVGGYDGSGPDSEVLATSDGHTFRVVAALPVPVRYPAVAARGGLLYVFGGEAVTGADAGQPVDDVQVVDPATDTATLAGHLSQAVEGAAAVALGGRIYVAGGDVAGGDVAGSGSSSSSSGAGVTTVPTVWRYDPSDGSVSVAGRLPVAVSHAGVAVTGSSAFLVGGETDGTVCSAVQRLTVM